ncbi:hypothetical protein C8J57DRAFT_1235859 [Mycena rebaudengoi]|nr:hypothetical protein C8J57DRAFT_1235859 [Mycena rebaudengoi]
MKAEPEFFLAESLVNNICKQIKRAQRFAALRRDPRRHHHRRRRRAPAPWLAFCFGREIQRKRSLSPLSRSSSVGHCDVDEDEDSPESEEGGEEGSRSKRRHNKKPPKAAVEDRETRAALAKAAKRRPSPQQTRQRQESYPRRHAPRPSPPCSLAHRSSPRCARAMEQQHHMRISVVSARASGDEGVRRGAAGMGARRRARGTRGDGALVYLAAGEGGAVSRRGRGRVERHGEDGARDVALEMAEHTHHLCVESVADATERLYDLSADLGIKPYKLIERSYFPFCADTHQAAGTGLRDT